MVLAAFNTLLIMSHFVCCCVHYATFYFYYSLHEKCDLHQIQVYVIYYHAYFGQCFISGDGLPKQKGGDALGLVLNSKFGRTWRVLMTQPVSIF